MSKKLLPHRVQVATPKASILALVCSNLPATGSRWVAGRVASFVSLIEHTYRLYAPLSSRCSTFVNKLRTSKDRGFKRRIRLTIRSSCYTCYPGEIMMKA